MQQKDEPFPKFAKDYFNQLREQYELMLEQSSAAGPLPTPPSVQRLLQKVDAAPDDTSWGDVFALESAFLYALPANRLPDELRIARDRYRDVVGPDQYDTYAKTVPPDTSLAHRSADELRSELLAIAERIRYIYTFEPPKEAARNRLAMRACLYTLLAALFGLAVYGATRQWAHATVVTILVVTFVGQMGGFLSVQQRLQASTGVDPLYKELQLTNGWFSVAVIAPISGSVFAIVLYFLFVGGLMSGGLFPHFGPAPAPTAPTAAPSPAPSPTPCPNDAYCSPLNVTQFLERATPTALEDWGKLLVWAFIAGFAERFVPDALSRMTGQATGSDGSSKPATSAPAAPVRKPEDEADKGSDDHESDTDANGPPVQSPPVLSPPGG